MPAPAVPFPAASPRALPSLDGGRRVLATVVLPLLLLACLAWVVTVRDADMGVSGALAFGTSWIVMMAAMMLPSVAPVVGLYALAARRGVVAAVPVFVAGYLLVWASTSVPAYAVARIVSDPLMEGEPWVARTTGAALIVAAGYQLTPLKTICLRHCRSPLSFFLGRTRSLARPGAAFAAGASHGLFCFGCCWAIMAVLVVLGGMQLGWALALALVLGLEKLAPWGVAAGRVAAVLAGALGVALLAQPVLLAHLVRL
jgi:predicted metal-binding membrane protein